jgi:hypothetical protein
MIESSCHCGTVKLEILSAPEAATRLRRLDSANTWKYLDECQQSMLDRPPD